MSTSARLLALPLAAIWVASAPIDASAQPCSALDRTCPPSPCRTASPECPEGQVCALALDSPPCPTLDAQCPHNGLCVSITQIRCDDHGDCQGAEVCYDKGLPLCRDGDTAQGPPCETPTSQPQGQCAPATECAEDAHCSPGGADNADSSDADDSDGGFFCDRVRVQLGFTRTEIGACAPRIIACQRPTDCPGSWTCEATRSPDADDPNPDGQDPDEQTPDGQDPDDRRTDATDAGGNGAEGICVPEGHALSCDEDGGCLILRRSPALALSSPFAAPASMVAPRSTDALAAERGEEDGAGGCQVVAKAASAPGGFAWAALALIGLLATRRRRR